MTKKKIGTAGQFIYDLNCIIDSRKRNFDIILQLGYTSSSLWFFLHPKKSIVITNMDSLEWKRTKYNKVVQQLLKYAEKVAVKKSDFLIAYSVGIQKYLLEKYQKNSTYIAYGSFINKPSEKKLLDQWNVKEYQYNMIMAKMEPENNFELVLNGYLQSNTSMPILVIGNHQTKYGNYLKNKFEQDKRILFLGAIYDSPLLNTLRFYSNIYFHGHTVGGTNPSLLEAMGSGALVVAHKNLFNRGVLKDNALYFENKNQVTDIVNKTQKQNYQTFIDNNFQEIEKTYHWDRITKQYLDFFESCIHYKAK